MNPFSTLNHMKIITEAAFWGASHLRVYKYKFVKALTHITLELHKGNRTEIVC